MRGHTSPPAMHPTPAHEDKSRGPWHKKTHQSTAHLHYFFMFTPTPYNMLVNTLTIALVLSAASIFAQAPLIVNTP